MILLDTNVLSEVMRPVPEPRVLAWLDSRADTDLWISAVTVAEVLLGIELLPAGKRRDQLSGIAERTFEEEFAERCLPFDALAAGKYASIVAKRTRQGRPVGVEDAQIAAIALAAGLTLATRNARDFAGIEGLAVTNPWAG